MKSPLAMVAILILSAALPASAGNLLDSRPEKKNNSIKIVKVILKGGQPASATPQFTVRLLANGEIDLVLEGTRIWASHHPNTQRDTYEFFTLDQTTDGASAGKIIINGYTVPRKNAPQVAKDSWHSLVNEPGMRIGFTPTYDFGFISQDGERLIQGILRWETLSQVIKQYVDTPQKTEHAAHIMLHVDAIQAEKEMNNLWGMVGMGAVGSGEDPWKFPFPGETPKIN